MRLVRSLRQLLLDEEGATGVEYAILASGIAVAAFLGIAALGTSVNGLYANAVTKLFPS